MDKPRLILKAALEEKGVEKKELSLRLGKNHAYIHQFLENGTPKSLRMEMAMEIGRLLGVDWQDLMPHRSLPEAVDSLSERLDALEDNGHVPVTGHPSSFNSVPQVDARAGAGAWAENGAETVTGKWAFPVNFFMANFNTDHVGAFRMLEITGDSMEPTLRSGDVVMVDTRDQSPSPAGLFVLNDGFGVVCKRVKPDLERSSGDDPWVLIQSDNPDYKPYSRALGEAHLIGRVVWMSRTL